jgi:putative transposase
MNFYPNQLFHVYNQGNNRQTIFYSDENYQYFLWKMKAYILPFADIISYCLMPTHFHWQIYVQRNLIERKLLRDHIESIELQRRKSKYGDSALVSESSISQKANENAFISLNESIGILQRAYTRALNKEKGWFRQFV